MTRLHEVCPCGTAFSIETDDDAFALKELTKFRKAHLGHTKADVLRKVFPYITNKTVSVKAEAARVSREFDTFLDRVTKKES